MYNDLMKLVIQIPCCNEEESLPLVLKNIPKQIDGIEEIKVVVIDDASDDKTFEIAKELNVDEVIHLSNRSGLSKVFLTGVQFALQNSADILVNIDGDNQYSAKCIEKLIKPILKNKTDMVIGARPINKIKTFSLFKKILQKFGSFVVKILSQKEVVDATSGFRAFSKNALLKLNVFNNFSYTIETILQAKQKNLKIENIAIDVNKQIGRKSRLFKNDFDYILKQGLNIVRFFIIYSPSRFFNLISLVLFLPALIIGLRFLNFYFNGAGSGHIQSLILCSILMTLSFITFMLSILAELFAINRRILEDMQFEIRKSKYEK